MKWVSHCTRLMQHKIKDNKVVVRSAKSGEKFTTLDETQRELNENDLMICVRLMECVLREYSVD